MSDEAGAQHRLDAAQLCQGCDVKELDFETTDDLTDSVVTVGQARAVEAIERGLGIERRGFNIFAVGSQGLGKRDIVNHFLTERAKGRPVPDEFCYVNNFDAPHEPRLLQVPAGRGRALKDAMARFVVDVKGALTTAFSSEEYRGSAQVIQQEAQEKQNEAIKEVEKKAQERGIALIRSQIGLGLAPIKDDQVLSPGEFHKLPDEERERIEKDLEELQKELQTALQRIPQMVADTREKMNALNDRTAEFAVRDLIKRINEDFSDLPQVQNYLDQVRKDVIANAENFLSAHESDLGKNAKAVPAEGPTLFWRYRVNLLVDQMEEKQAPVIYEDEPSFERLIGRIEHRAEMGSLVTDFNLIRPGSLHRANGGYLLIDALRLLRQPLAYDALKRALEAGEIRIEPMMSAMGLMRTTMVEPEPVPLSVKVVLVGDRYLYHLLAAYDPDFGNYFKILADFDETVDRSTAHQTEFVKSVASHARAEEMRAFERGAVSKLVEFAARRAEDGKKLSADREAVRDLMREADFLASQDGRQTVGAPDVDAAWAAEIRRKGRMWERMQEAMERDLILIDTDGAEVGQINALSVFGVGDVWYGKPSRITARVRLGRGDVVDIEREVKLGGPLHSKGVLILSGYLGGHYAGTAPLSLSASLVFEQSYGGVDGDSASAAELFALVSALAEVPIKQSLAVTGSVNQRGMVQAIGAVNEKIEGFFDLCAARGLTGEQGVLIPAANVDNLMLHERIVDAVRTGQFHIYAIETIDAGVEILTGLPAGERDQKGRFPADTVNGKVQARLFEFLERRRELMRPEAGAGDQ